MSLKEAISLQKEFSTKLESLCERPLATSKEEAELWQNNHEEYLKVKSLNIQSVSSALFDDIDKMYITNKETYYDFVKSWYAFGWEQYQIYLLEQDEDLGLISGKEFSERKKVIKNTNFKETDIKTMVQDFFTIFELIINKMKNNEEWYELYKASRIRGDDLVFNISSLDLFTWQLPSSDTREINDYNTVAKIMTIYFFIENIYKNESSIMNDNPFNKAILNLDKILSYYNFIIKKEAVL